MNKFHQLQYSIIRSVASIILFFKFGYRKEVAKDLPDNYIVVANHLTN